jgi:hypothetical protein
MGAQRRSAAQPKAMPQSTRWTSVVPSVTRGATCYEGSPALAEPTSGAAGRAQSSAPLLESSLGEISSGVRGPAARCIRPDGDPCQYRAGQDDRRVSMRLWSDVGRDQKRSGQADVRPFLCTPSLSILEPRRIEELGSPNRSADGREAPAEEMMESQEFDRIVKGLGQPASRRTATKALAVGGLGAALARRWDRPQCRPDNERGGRFRRRRCHSRP